LTDEGEALIPAIADSFSRLRATLERFEKGNFRGVVSIGVVGTFATGWLLPRLGAFGEAYPFVDLRIQTNNNRVDLAGEGLDFAIRYGNGSWRNTDAVHLFPAPLSPSARCKSRSGSARPQTSPKKHSCAPTSLTSGRAGSPPPALHVPRSRGPSSIHR
jgi:LysR family transcriptional regulator, regulator of gene expression of beta-lactamase